MIPIARLGDFLAQRSRGIVPNRTPSARYELYSVPAFENRAPEILSGAEIGSNKQVVEPGTVLLCKINPRINRAWVVGSATNYTKIASTEWIAFPPHQGVEPKYLAYFLSKANLRDYLAANTSGVGGSLMRVKSSIVKDLVLPLPQLGVQRRVVDEIEKQFSRLDEGVIGLERVKKNLKRQKAATLRSAIEGRLMSDADPSARRWRRIGEVAQVISGLTKSPRRVQLPRKLPYLRVANVYANELRLDDVQEIGVADNELEKLLLKRGDLLVVEGNGSAGQIGRVAIWDGSIPNCVHQNHLIKLRFSDEVLPEWALIWLLSPRGRHEIEQVASSTSGLHTLSTGKIAGLPIPVPPRMEQQRVVAEIDRRLCVDRKLEEDVDANLKRAASLRQSILSKAFSLSIEQQRRQKTADVLIRACA